MVPGLPTAAANAAQELVIVGTLADVVEDQFVRILNHMGIERVRFFPPRRADDQAPIGTGTRLLLAQPFLADTAKALQARGASLLPAPFPLGIEGTTAWLQSAATAFGVSQDRFDASVAAPTA
jgi:light-independent protochlorophyllide reductase subunit N